jgi:hypothetical protein
MASTLKINTLTGVTTAGSIAVTGEGNSTTTNLQQGLAKAWVFGGTDASLTDNFNITSGTDNGTGDYSYAITNDMANANYSILGTASNAVANDPVISCNPSDDVTATGSYRLQIGLTGQGTDNFAQADKVHYSAIFGDLA